MRSLRFVHHGVWAAMGCLLLSLSAIGCQTTVSGQTLPSAYYLDDDVQFFPAGPETPLPNLRRALEQHRIEHEAIEQGLGPAQP